MPSIPKKPKIMTETTILLAIRAELAKDLDVLIFRNNVGKLRDANGRVVSYGLAIGSADLIGSLRVGRIGDRPCVRPLAIEVKMPGEKPTLDQARWLDTVRRHGWVAAVCYSVTDALTLVRQAKSWEI